ncbi:MAG: hypothetical protein HY253_03700 [Burkholderiales bacterium]|nr:hypothetical protein [Burkholderiales bacterium]
MVDSVNEEESFYLEYDWLIGHVRSLAMSPEDCSEDQGNFNVAHELWYFISQAEHMILDPIQIMTEEQRASVQTLIHIVEAIPEDARRWTTIGQESVENMRHEAWNNARVQAKKVLRDLAPISILREKFYA